MKKRSKLIKLIALLLVICFLVPVVSKQDAYAKKKKTYVVCIDPGHYKKQNKVKGKKSYGYSEAEFNLKVAKELKKELKSYGIEVKMTRTGKNIKLFGFKNKILDDYYLSLRGEYAEDCDLFVSLHTNSNAINANKHKTFEQTIALNKTIVIVNQKTMQKKKYMNMANEIGKAVTNASFEAGLLEKNKFKTKTKKSIKEWTGGYNDGEGQKGTVCYRLNSRGTDYYGVLRGAANVGVPGMIIEHGYHSIPEVRYAAKYEDLASKWAKADAYGIAKGFGLVE